MEGKYLHSEQYVTPLTKTIGLGVFHTATSVGVIEITTRVSATLGRMSGMTVKWVGPTWPSACMQQRAQLLHSSYTSFGDYSSSDLSRKQQN